MSENKLIVLVGISGAGKSTFADDYLSKNPDTVYLSDGQGERALLRYSSNSFSLYATISTTDPNVSPIISDDGVSLYSVKYLINNMGIGNNVISITNSGNGYTNPKSTSGSVKLLSPGYSLDPSKVSNRPSLSVFSAGFFVEDYQFTNSGDLDQYNGRFCITPEFPNGTYAYFCTQDLTNTSVYPYFVGPKGFYGSITVDPNTALDDPDYITINRGSIDLNAWSRRNRWFHKDIIAMTEIYNGTSYEISSNSKARRPIIEFDASLKLFNFGTTKLPDVDLLDTFTVNVFSAVEGHIGYNIDNCIYI